MSLAPVGMEKPFSGNDLLTTPMFNSLASNVLASPGPHGGKDAETLGAPGRRPVEN